MASTSECVKVIVRCRPMNTREKDLECKPVIIIEESRAYCAIKNPNDEKAPPKPFTFDGAYDINSTTENIYNEIAYPLIEGVTEGYNGTIFAYGQTGCGKSFTMQGISDPSTQRGIIPRSSGFDNSSAQKGIIPRSFDHIFETVSVTEGKKFLIHAAYCEIYNEEIRDLLGKDIKAKMELKEHPEKGVYVNGLSMHPVHNVHECERIMTKGWNNRSTGATLMNTDSSRSHSIFTINLEMATVDDEGEEHIRAGKLNLVDLAGSERQAKTEAVTSSGGHDRPGICNVSQRSFFEDTRMDEEDSSSNSSLHGIGNGYSFRASQPGNGSILVGHTVGQQGASSSHSRLITDHNISNDNIRQRNFSNPLNEHQRRHEKISVENIKHEVIEIFDLDTNDSPQPDDEMRSSPSPNVQSTEGSSHGTPQSSTENTGTLLLSSSPPALLDVQSMASAYNCDVNVSIPSNLYHNRAQSQDNSTAQSENPYTRSPLPIQSPQPFQGQKDNSTIFILPNDDPVDQTSLQSSHVHAGEHNKKTVNGSSEVQGPEILDRRLQTFKHENDFSRKRTSEDMATEATFPTTRDVLKMQYEVLIEEKKKIRLEQRNLNLRNKKLRLDIKRLEKELQSSL